MEIAVSTMLSPFGPITFQTDIIAVFISNFFHNRNWNPSSVVTLILFVDKIVGSLVHLSDWTPTYSLVCLKGVVGVSFVSTHTLKEIGKYPDVFVARTTSSSMQVIVAFFVRRTGSSFIVIRSLSCTNLVSDKQFLRQI
jgi:hypothetical protein